MWSCVRPSISTPICDQLKIYRGLKRAIADVDLIVVRENTEGLYSGIEHEVVPGVMESLKITTEKACTRIAKFAFDYRSGA